MTTCWKPYHEPLHTTLLRNVTIAVLVGALLTRYTGGGVSRWLLATLLALWPALGGHYAELFFLNVLRPHLPPSRPIQIIARLSIWFLAGLLLAIALLLTASYLSNFHPHPFPHWWLPGLAFIAIELLIHLALYLGHRPNFYNNQG